MAECRRGMLYDTAAHKRFTDTIMQQLIIYYKNEIFITYNDT
jgi:hypothetical protein